MEKYKKLSFWPLRNSYLLSLSNYYDLEFSRDITSLLLSIIRTVREITGNRMLLLLRPKRVSSSRKLFEKWPEVNDSDTESWATKEMKATQEANHSHICYLHVCCAIKETLHKKQDVVQATTEGNYDRCTETVNNLSVMTSVEVRVYHVRDMQDLDRSLCLLFNGMIM